ncbi:helix-turn-helix domain-containing protein [Salinimonas lutimaris]|uniref:helix-turn-helix domain-containing protein n=1 Tax=Salinimonas lutimaris TaxID=914153 RepID=UPI0010BF7D00|nr:XRE family transcriptional regulator [Salinimonas lutimaris]
MTDISAVNQQIGQQLKTVRTAKGWSLDKTATATGVSKAMLGQIERGESSPTIATLWKIATGLSCSFSSFIAHPDAHQQVFSREPGSTFTRDPDMQVKTLFAFNPQTRMEAFEITLTRQHEQRSGAHTAGVTEHIHVISGVLDIQQGEHWHRVHAGEQFVLTADLPHAYKDVQGKVCFMDIICYP